MVTSVSYREFPDTFVIQVIFIPSGPNPTCKSLHHLANHMQALHPLGGGTVCNTADGCLGIQCTHLTTPYYYKILLHPCLQPRALHIIVVYDIDNNSLLDEVVNRSTVLNFTTPGGFQIVQVNVTFEDRMDSVLVGVSDCTCNDTNGHLDCHFLK